ncbi:Hypothetical predicted protein [Paramuricea clavata]|uniref:Uncharacterized protein n=1 Tax=Paramuricea clavata TaxID=317549 RepID=A0A6S7GZX1_PARCT|nr:Hypothetical predicted protein [Paramuricea clavata]
MSKLFLDIMTFSVAAGAALIYIHTLEAKEARREATEAERKENEDWMLETLDRKFSLILEEKLKLNGQGYKEAVKRHNQALEKLAKAKERFYESEVKRRNDEARRRAKILDANKDIEETNRALEDLRDYTRLMDSTASQRRPKLEDYYQQSDEIKRYAMLTVGELGVGGAYGLTRIF